MGKIPLQLRSDGLPALLLSLAAVLALLIAAKWRPASETLPKPVSGTARLHPEQTQYPSGSPVRVYFEGLPGNLQDWMTVVPADATPTTYREWYYLKGQHQGTQVFSNTLTPGTYEVRLYYDWPRGDYQIQARSAFRVIDATQGALSTDKNQYTGHETVTVYYQGLPGNAQDWISVVPAHSDSPQDAKRMQQFTHGRGEGSVAYSGPFAPGRYEARLYYDWPKGEYQIQARHEFEVRSP